MELGEEGWQVEAAEEEAVSGATQVEKVEHCPPITATTTTTTTTIKTTITRPSLRRHVTQLLLPRLRRSARIRPQLWT